MNKTHFDCAESCAEPATSSKEFKPFTSKKRRRKGRYVGMQLDRQTYSISANFKKGEENGLIN